MAQRPEARAVLGHGERGGRKFAALVFLYAAFAVATACSGRGEPLQASIVGATPDAPAVIRIDGLSTHEARALERAGLDRSAWEAFARIAVAGQDTPVAGAYLISGRRVLFRPAFPFDPGREYTVRIDPAKLPDPRSEPPIVATVALPATKSTAPETMVTGVSPGTGVWPENLLRFYIHFSAPMSRATALDHITLAEVGGEEVRDAFLPLDVDLWNSDRTRFTVFFDPGRVKRGIRPNVELGRALVGGRRYVLTVRANWPDATGRPLASDYRYEFQAGAAEERAIDPAAWRIAAPAAGTRDALVVSFPWALDRGLLQRALGVTMAEAPVPGDAAIDTDDRVWRFTPSAPWAQGPHALIILTLLEDPAGNRVGRPFEIEMFTSKRTEERKSIAVEFTVR